MPIKTWLSRGRRELCRFGRSQRGNVAITFAFATLPLICAVGAAIDYSRANSVKTAMQAALDTTALMLAKEASTETATQLQTNAEKYFAALFTRPEAQNSTVTATYTATGGSTVVVDGSVQVPTIFMGVIGFNAFDVNTSSTAKWGSTRLRVALVLDVSGSMSSSGKIGALKTATKSLLTQLQSAASVDGDVYVSIIPFSKNVNLGAGSYDASWIDWTDWEAEPVLLDTARGGAKPSNWSSIGPGSSCPFSNSRYGFQCTTGPSNGSSTTSTIPSSGSYAGYICPSVDSGAEKSTKIGIYYNGCYNSVATTTTTTTTVSSGRSASCGGYSNCTCTGSGNSKVCTQTVTTTGAPYTHTWIKNAHSTWTGCVTDRGDYAGPVSDYDRLATAPDTGITATLFPAEQSSYCSPSTATELTFNWTTLNTEVDGLTPNGATNQPIGLVWGWQSLVGGGPLSVPAKDSNYTYNDVIILLSDGLNTLDRWYGNGSTTNTSVDARMYDSSGAGTCANIKAAGITIYTIQVNTGGDATSTLLQNCASDSSKFYLLTSASAMLTTFNAIGTQLTQLRVAK